MTTPSASSSWSRIRPAKLTRAPACALETRASRPDWSMGSVVMAAWITGMDTSFSRMTVPAGSQAYWRSSRMVVSSTVVPRMSLNSAA